MNNLEDLMRELAAQIAEAEGADYAETLAIVRAWLAPDATGPTPIRCESEAES